MSTSDFSRRSIYVKAINAAQDFLEKSINLLACIKIREQALNERGS
jgi:hypothetical protein